MKETEHERPRVANGSWRRQVRHTNKVHHMRTCARVRVFAWV